MILLPKLTEWIQVPGIALPDQAKNCREVVGEDDETEPTAVDQPCSLEDFIVLVGDGLGAAFFTVWNSVWVAPRSTLIDLQDLLGDILRWQYVRLRTKVEIKEYVRCDCG